MIFCQVIFSFPIIVFFHYYFFFLSIGPCCIRGSCTGPAHGCHQGRCKFFVLCLHQKLFLKRLCLSFQLQILNLFCKYQTSTLRQLTRVRDMLTKHPEDYYVANWLKLNRSVLQSAVLSGNLQVQSTFVLSCVNINVTGDCSYCMCFVCRLPWCFIFFFLM